VSIIVIVTYLIGLGGFAHIIAGSNKLFFLVVAGVESTRRWLREKPLEGNRSTFIEL
jgi:hypothetical protein